MFSSSIHTLPSIETWEAAHNWFDATPRPRSTQKWADNQRPLKDTRSWHYRIERYNGGEYYDVILHRTVMARYYKPAAGGRRVLYTGHPSNMSKQFMRRVLNVRHDNTWTTTDGRLVAVPIANRDSVTDKGSTFSTDLWLVRDKTSHGKRIDVAKSSHTTHYVKRMSPDDRATHKRARANMESLITLACMRIPEFHKRVYLDPGLLRPFSGVAASHQAWQALEAIVSGQFATLKPEQQERHIEAFMKLAEDTYDYEAVMVVAKDYIMDALDAVAEHVTEKVLADALWRIAKRECSTLKRRSDAIQLAPFMDAKDFPNTATPYP
jgi:hypothetical protein